MKFISIFTQQPTGRRPTEAEMAAMGNLIEQAMKEGWLLATEGVSFGGVSVKVHKPGPEGDITVTDGPFAEAKEVLGGYALLKAGSREEVVALCRRFLNVTGQGTCQVYELFQP
ncbi:MAG: YciI family protein [Myxococcales bacterium]